MGWFEWVEEVEECGGLGSSRGQRGLKLEMGKKEIFVKELVLQVLIGGKKSYLC